MIADVPTADVVVTNPTHFAVALRYDGKKPAPEVVAKGADLVAAAIRELAREHGVPILANPPLARALYHDVEVGQMIPDRLLRRRRRGARVRLPHRRGRRVRRAADARSTSRTPHGACRSKAQRRACAIVVPGRAEPSLRARLPPPSRMREALARGRHRRAAS